MSLCASCGTEVSNGSIAGLCNHHTYTNLDDWATANRIFCNGLHRGQWPIERHEVGPDENLSAAPTAPVSFWD